MLVAPVKSTAQKRPAKVQKLINHTYIAALTQIRGFCAMCALCAAVRLLTQSQATLDFLLLTTSCRAMDRRPADAA